MLAKSIRPPKNKTKRYHWFIIEDKWRGDGDDSDDDDGDDNDDDGEGDGDKGNDSEAVKAAMTSEQLTNIRGKKEQNFSIVF